MLYLSANSASTGSWSMFNMIAQLFSILAVFIGVILLAVFVTKWMASAKYVNRGNNNLKLLDSIGLGYQNGIHLVKAGKKYVLLGITKDKITFLCELSETDVELDEEIKEQPSFENYFNKILSRKKEDK